MREFNRVILRAMPRRTLALAIAGVALAAPAMYATLGSSARSAMRPAQKNAASIKTDRASYLAGDKIKISGAGFTPLESVMLQVKHANGTMENGMGHDAIWVYPGADGTFEATWTININDSAGTSFVVTASGSTGDAAQASFTRNATVAVNPFNSSRGKSEIVAGGFRPNELITVRAGAASQTVRADENGRATVVAEIADGSETTSVSATSVTSELVALSVAPADFYSNGWFSIVDSTYAQAGAACSANPNGYCQDDVPLQNDLTRMGRNDTDPAQYKVFMSWNSVTSWTGTGQTGNACALFSNRADGNIQFAVCAAVENTPGNPTVIRQVAGSPYAFTCAANKNDRCSQPAAITLNGNVVAGPFGTPSIAGDLVTPTDPFPTAVGDLDHQDKDTTIEMDIVKSFLQTGLPANSPALDLVNVCSYPSAGSGGNNNPFDCIVRPSSGFLRITKNTSNATSTFTFDLKKGTGNSATLISSPPITPVQIPNTSNYSQSSSIIPLDLATDYAVYERSNTGWNLDSKACVITSSTGTAVGGSAGIAGGVSGVEVKSGKVTECSFSNSQVQPQLTLIKNVINDNGGKNLATDWTLSANAAGDSNSFAIKTSAVNNNPLQGTTGPRTVSIGVTYTLSESSISGYSVKTDWTCNGGTLVSNTIKLAAGTVATCQITNDDNAATLVPTTVQRVVLHDSVTLSGYRDPQPDGKARGTVDFRLFSDAGCQNQVGAETGRPISIVSGNGSAATSTGVTVSPATPTQYWWKVIFSGDQYNTGVTEACHESTAITITNN